MPRHRTLLTAAALAGALSPLGAASASADVLGPIGRPGAGTGSLDKPWGIAAAPDGRLYVTETGRGRVSVFDSAGVAERTFGSLSGASGVAVGPGGVYVVERDASRVARFTAAGTPLGTFGSKGVGNGQFQVPDDVALQGSNVLVTSQSRFQRFSSTGTFVDGHGGSGANAYDAGLRGIATAADGRIFTTEAPQHRIQRLSSALAPELQWGDKGTLDGQLTTPTGIGVDTPSASVWVTDLAGGSVQRFGFGGQFRERLDTGPAGAPGHVSYPTDVAVDCRGTVYVVDGVAEQVQRFGAKEAAPVGQDLLRNGGFEEGGASCDDTAAAAGAGPGWSTGGGAATAVHYGAGGGFPTRADGDGPNQGGQSFLAGGPEVAKAVKTQRVDVSAQALDIDDGRRLARLSGLLGGFATQEDQASVSATYEDAGGKALGTTTLAPVTAGDRGGKTALLPRVASATVPKGTRAITVSVALVRAGSSGYNDAYADRLALTLTPQRPGALPLPTTKPAPPAPSARRTRVPRLTVSNVATLHAVRRHRFVVSVACDRSCSARSTVTLGARRLATRSTPLGRGTRRVTLPVGPAARRALLKVIRKDGKAGVTLRVSAKDALGRTTTLQRTLVVYS